jgi:hypothetical protein
MSQPSATHRKCGELGYADERALVRAAFRAAARRSAGPLVCDAFLAAAERSPAVRRRAAAFACLDRASCEAAAVPSRFRAS